MRVGLVAAKDVAHTVRFKLEDGGGVATCKKFVGSFVVEKQIFDINFDAAILLDHLHRVVQNGKGGESEEIHLEQADTLEGVHVVLGGDFIAVRFVNGNEFGERFGRDNDTGSVGGSVAGEAFETKGDLHEIFEAFVGIYGGFQLWRFLEGNRQFDAEGGRN